MIQNKFYKILLNRKYEILLVGLILHTFAGIFIKDLTLYSDWIWPITLSLLAICCYEIFWEQGRGKKVIFALMAVVLGAFPFIAIALNFGANFMEFLSIAFTIYFSFIFYELMRFLLSPKYGKTDIITASISGYLLLILIMTFLLLAIYYENTTSFKGVDISDFGHAYIDFVYFSTITLTSLGYGDITPISPQMKLLVSLFSLVGQFYSVVLIGILFTNINKRITRE